jgi:hypothetical protein
MLFDLVSKAYGDWVMKLRRATGFVSLYLPV